MHNIGEDMMRSGTTLFNAVTIYYTPEGSETSYLAGTLIHLHMFTAFTAQTQVPKHMYPYVPDTAPRGTTVGLLYLGTIS